MKLELQIYGSLCATKVFKINGVLANTEDFGSQYDNDLGNAKEYGCGDMVFERKPPTNDVLKKYKISDKEYEQIAKKLEDGLSFGNCGWCV